ncbi:radical SAM protein [Methanofollis aquaemaris]|nr:radical SAM protein [Methanofollis aquaemaris]
MRCHYCDQGCNLDEGKTGICGTYHLSEGRVLERFPYRWSSYFASHIESLPFFHAYPGSRALLVGTAGCNASCRYCSNAYVARTDPATFRYFQMEPEALVRKARLASCHSIIFGINEPTVSFPSFRDLALAAHAAGLQAGCLTNGCMTGTVAEEMAQVCDFVNLSVKSLSEEFYRDYIGIDAAKTVLRNLKTLAAGCHVEVTTPIIQSVNDIEIPEIAAFIRSIDSNIPWHVFRLLPEYEMKDERYPDIEEITSLLTGACKHLPYIYFSNFAGSQWTDTRCPSCGRAVITRISPGGCGAKLTGYHLDGDRCPTCGTKIPVLGGHRPWDQEGTA